MSMTTVMTKVGFEVYYTKQQHTLPRTKMETMPLMAIDMRQNSKPGS